MAKPSGPHARTSPHTGAPHGDGAGQRESATIPDKLYFRIGEVASICAVPAYVLRFWQTEFPQLRPSKSGTGQRLYRRRDVEMALRIKHLLYDEGYTIAGAKGVFAGEVRAAREQPELPLPAAPVADEKKDDHAHAKLHRLRGELRELLHMLNHGGRGGNGKPQTLRKATGPSLFPEGTESDE